MCLVCFGAKFNLDTVHCLHTYKWVFALLCAACPLSCSLFCTTFFMGVCAALCRLSFFVASMSKNYSFKRLPIPKPIPTPSQTHPMIPNPSQTYTPWKPTTPLYRGSLYNLDRAGLESSRCCGLYIYIYMGQSRLWVQCIVSAWPGVASN